MRSPKVWSRSEVWKGSNSTWSRTHYRSFKYMNLKYSPEKPENRAFEYAFLYLGHERAYINMTIQIRHATVENSIKSVEFETKCFARFSVNITKDSKMTLILINYPYNFPNFRSGL